MRSLEARLREGHACRRHRLETHRDHAHPERRGVPRGHLQAAARTRPARSAARGGLPWRPRRSPRCSAVCAARAWSRSPQGARHRLTEAGGRGRLSRPPPPPQRALPRRRARDAVGRGPRRGLQARARAEPRGRGASRGAARQPSTCPHGHVIPGEDGRRRAELHRPRRLGPGEAAIIGGIAEEKTDLLRYLASLGLLPDAPVRSRASRRSAGRCSCASAARSTRSAARWPARSWSAADAASHTAFGRRRHRWSTRPARTGRWSSASPATPTSASPRCSTRSPGGLRDGALRRRHRRGAAPSARAGRPAHRGGRPARQLRARRAGRGPAGGAARRCSTRARTWSSPSPTPPTWPAASTCVLQLLDLGYRVVVALNLVRRGAAARADAGRRGALAGPRRPRRGHRGAARRRPRRARGRRAAGRRRRRPRRDRRHAAAARRRAARRGGGAAHRRAFRRGLPPRRSRRARAPPSRCSRATGRRSAPSASTDGASSPTPTRASR